MGFLRGAIALVAVPAIALAGCGQAAETAVENATGADIEMSDEGVTVMGEGGESMTIDSDGGGVTFTDEEEGLTISAGGDQELPASLPAGFPVPPADSITAVSETDDGVTLVSWSWSAMTKQDVENYLKELASAGYVEQSDRLLQDYGDEGFTLVTSVVSQTHEVTVNAQSMQGMGGISTTVQAIQ